MPSCNFCSIFFIQADYWCSNRMRIVHRCTLWPKALMIPRCSGLYNDEAAAVRFNVAPCRPVSCSFSFKWILSSNVWRSCTQTVACDDDSHTDSCCVSSCNTIQDWKQEGCPLMLDSLSADIQRRKSFSCWRDFLKLVCSELIMYWSLSLVLWTLQ